MTQPGSFPDQPRGRRARHGGEPGDWRGREDIPLDDREFPDLEPIRGRRLSESDNRGLPGGGRGRHSAGGRDDGQGGAPWDGQPAPYDRPQYSGQQLSGQQPGQRQYTGQPAGGQPEHDQPQYAGQPSRDEQTGGHRLGGRSRGRQQQAGPPPKGGHRGHQPDPDELTDDPMEAFSERWARRGADTPHDRRRRRVWYIGGGGVVVVAVAVIAYFLFGGSSSPSNSFGFGQLVTQFLPGEIQKVPDACSAVPKSTLNQYLAGGQPEIAAPPLNGGQDSQCTWTLDSAPTYRVIEVDISAFSPSGLASGNGSATNAAIDAYANDQDAMQNPTAKSGQPKATITSLTGLGDVAFSATQVFNISGTTTYKATVIVRYHNVIVTAVVNGLEHAVTSKGTYGPVSMSELTTAAQQVATAAVTAVKS